MPNIDSQILSDRVRAENAIIKAEEAIEAKEQAETSATNAATSETNASDSASDAQKQAQQTTEFTDSKGINFDKGAKGWYDDSKVLVDNVQDAINEALTQTDVNPNYVSYDIGTLPDSTGAEEGTIGMYVTDSGLLQKVKWETDAWVNVGEPISTKKYIDDKASLSVLATDFGLKAGVTNAASLMEDLFAVLNQIDGKVTLAFPYGTIDVGNIDAIDVEVPIKIIGNGTIIKGGGLTDTLFNFKRSFKVEGVEFQDFKYPIDYKDMGLEDGLNSDDAIVTRCIFDNVYCPMVAYPSAEIGEENVHSIETVEFSWNKVRNCQSGFQFRYIDPKNINILFNEFDDIVYTDTTLGSLMNILSIGSSQDNEIAYLQDLNTKIIGNKFKNVTYSAGQMFGNIVYRGTSQIHLNEFENFVGGEGENSTSLALYSEGDCDVTHNIFKDAAKGTHGAILTKGRKELGIYDNTFTYSDAYKTTHGNIEYTGISYTKMDLFIERNTFNNCTFPIRAHMESGNFDGVKTDFKCNNNIFNECTGSITESGRIVTMGLPRYTHEFCGNTFKNIDTQALWSIYISDNDDYYNTDVLKIKDNTVESEDHNPTANILLHISQLAKKNKIKDNYFTNNTPNQIQRCIFIGNSVVGFEADLTIEGNHFKGMTIVDGSDTTANNTLIANNFNIRNLIIRDNTVEDDIYKLWHNNSGTIKRLDFIGNYVENYIVDESNFLNVLLRFDDSTEESIETLNIHGNHNIKDFAKGIITIPNGSTSASVAHEIDRIIYNYPLIDNKENVNLNFVGSPGSAKSVWVDTLDYTNIGVAVDADPGADIEVSYELRL